MTTSYEEARERLAAYGRGERRFDVWSGFDDPHSAILEDLRAFLAGPPDQAKCEHLPDLYACEMGVGCELQGVCFAKANGQPERCAIRPMLSVELRSEEEVVGVLDRLITADIQGPTHGVWDRAYRACVQDAKVNLQALYRSRRNG